MPWTARFGSKRAVVAFTGLRSPSAKRADLRYTAELVASSELAAVIDACYPLES
jgi:hypothetical protein